MLSRISTPNQHPQFAPCGRGTGRPLSWALGAVANTAAAFLSLGAMSGASGMCGILKVRASTDFYALTMYRT
jgi:hypothetical protein